MEFNLSKYLSENKLTKLSYLREDEDILDVSPDLDEPAIDLDGEDEEDDWNKPVPEDGEEDYEAEPTKPEEQPAQQDVVSSQEKQEYERLKNYVKDLIAQYKKSLITIDDYKEKIYNDPKHGNIVQKLKKLDKKFYPAVTAGEEEEEDKTV